MIGIRAVATAALAAAVCAGGLGAGPGPEGSLAADRLVLERALEADERLAALDAALAPALDAARRGAARIVAGDMSPADALDRAAEATGAAEPDARRAVLALERLDAARRARRPGTASSEMPSRPGELSSIAAQLSETADAGEAFAVMRRRADEVPRSLEAALTALDAADLDAAGAAVERAREHHDALREWDLVLATLPVWLETTDAMIGAVETIVAATRTGDAAAARDAAEAFAAVADEASVADRALRIAVSEGGAAVTAAALGRLADAVASVRAARAEVAAILQAARE